MSDVRRELTRTTQPDQGCRRKSTCRTAILRSLTFQRKSPRFSKAVGGRETENDLPQLGNAADYVVADGPDSQTETSRALLLCADLTIVPCKASMLEVGNVAIRSEVLKEYALDVRPGRWATLDRPIGAEFK